MVRWRSAPSPRLVPNVRKARRTGRRANQAITAAIEKPVDNPLIHGCECLRGSVRGTVQRECFEKFSQRCIQLTVRESRRRRSVPG